MSINDVAETLALYTFNTCTHTHTQAHTCMSPLQMKAYLDQTIQFNAVPHSTFCAGMAIGGAFAQHHGGRFLAGVCRLCSPARDVSLCPHYHFERAACLLLSLVHSFPLTLFFATGLSGSAVTAARVLLNAALATGSCEGTILISDAAMQVCACCLFCDPCKTGLIKFVIR